MGAGDSGVSSLMFPARLPNAKWPSTSQTELGNLYEETGSRRLGIPPFLVPFLPSPIPDPPFRSFLRHTSNYELPTLGAVYPRGARLCPLSLAPSTLRHSHPLSQLPWLSPTRLCFSEAGCHVSLAASSQHPHPHSPSLGGRDTSGGARNSPATPHLCPPPTHLNFGWRRRCRSAALC